MEYIITDSGIIKCVLRDVDEGTFMYNLKKQCIQKGLTDEEIINIKKVVLYGCKIDNYEVPEWVTQLVKMEFSKYSK